MSTDRPFVAHIEGAAQPLRILGAEGRERLGRLYRFDLELAEPIHVDPLSHLRQGVRIELTVGDQVRVVAGIVTRARAGAPLRDGLRTLHLRIEPRLSALRRRTDSRIFQELSSLEIAALVLLEHQVPFEPSIATLKRREVAIQHQETDLELVRRLLAEDGISFHFKQPAAGESVPETIVFIDSERGYVPLEGGDGLVFRPFAEGDLALASSEDAVLAFEREGRARAEAAATLDYDFARPLVPAVASEKLHREEVFRHHGPYGETQPGESAARVLGRHRRRVERGEGRALSPRVAPGRKFRLSEHVDATFDREWAIVEVTHRVAPEQEKKGPRYENRFSVVEADRFLMPKVPARRVHQSLETATVTGPGTEVIHTDTLGRIKVHFHWDRRGQFDENASCWIRVAQPWAGAGFGHQFIPRVGMEVLVAFIGGDLDRPLCIGAVPNATHLMPFPLPGQRTRSGLRTHSVGAKEGFNELSFEAAAGGEEVRLRAQRNLEIMVLKDETESIDGNATKQIGGNMALSVAGAHRVDVTGPSLASFASDAALHHGADTHTTVVGDVTLEVSANRRAKIAGTDDVSVGGDRSDYAKGAHTVRADARYALTSGTSLIEGQIELTSTGQLAANADKELVLRSAGVIRIACGESSIVIEPSKITLESPEVELLAKKSFTAKGDGPHVRLTKEAEIASEKLRLLTKNASLELDEEAKLRGSKIALSSGKPLEKEKTDEEKAETDEVNVKLTDEKFKPYASKRYEAHAAGKKLREPPTGTERRSSRSRRERRTSSCRCGSTPIRPAAGKISISP